MPYFLSLFAPDAPLPRSQRSKQSSLTTISDLILHPASLYSLHSTQLHLYPLLFRIADSPSSYVLCFSDTGSRESKQHEGKSVCALPTVQTPLRF
jgi:hypothetical protein